MTDPTPEQLAAFAAEKMGLPIHKYGKHRQWHYVGTPSTAFSPATDANHDAMVRKWACDNLHGKDLERYCLALAGIWMGRSLPVGAMLAMAEEPGDYARALWEVKHDS